jgi:hypothetical protein
MARIERAAILAHLRATRLPTEIELTEQARKFVGLNGRKSAAD